MLISLLLVVVSLTIMALQFELRHVRNGDKHFICCSCCGNDIRGFCYCYWDWRVILSLPGVQLHYFTNVKSPLDNCALPDGLIFVGDCFPP